MAAHSLLTFVGNYVNQMGFQRFLPTVIVLRENVTSGSVKLRRRRHVIPLSSIAKPANPIYLEMIGKTTQPVLLYRLLLLFAASLILSSTNDTRHVALLEPNNF
ncbi:hypothetical protein CBL_07506 [Carabus blaptoides fortunei]